MILFTLKRRVINWREILRGEKLEMRNQENQMEYKDITLVLFVVIAGWFLLFYSGLFL